jgi:hypothetical protein
MSAVIFLGPSLPRPEAEAVLDADYRPPVRQGDVYRLLQDGRPEAIAVIDGYFQDVPSVWHKEILFALDQGVPVFGAASMGALRAAELEDYGMTGVGKIFEAYRRGLYPPFDSAPFEDDDEVAVIHGPAELDFPALSDAMVDLRETLAAAERAGVITRALRDALAGAFKRRFYHHRSFDALPEVLNEVGADAAAAAALLNWLPEGRIAQKRADALALLERLAAGRPPAPSPRKPFVFERTTLWAQFVELSAAQTGGLSVAEASVLEELRLDPPRYEAARRNALLRLVVEGVVVPDAVDDAGRRAALDRLRRRRGLLTREMLEAWASDNDLDRAGLDRLLDFEAALEDCAGQAGAALDRALLDGLRAEDSYVELSQRADDKAACLAQMQVGVAAPSALSSGALLDWYFETCLSQRVPEDTEAFARRLGFQGVGGFLAAVAREQAYQTLCAAERAGGTR